nr:hypothetical protein [Sphingomonas sp.]
MHDADALLDRPRELGARTSVCRADGTDVPVRLRLLGYDNCEFESDYPFAIGDRVSIRLYRMGYIRARVTVRQGNVVEAEFVKDCPV